MIDYTALIEINPNIMLGKPVVKDTRITAELILEELSAGKMMADLLAAHPRLTQEGIWAAFGICSRCY